MKSVSAKYTVKNLVAVRREELSRLGEKATLLISSRLEKTRDRLAVEAGKANALSPLAILSRGYSITEREGKVVSSVDQLNAGDTVDLILSDGRVRATVNFKK